MLYIGMFFFSLAIVSGMWGFAGIGVAPDRIAQLVFFASLLAASITFAVCLLRTAARARGEDRDGSGGWHDDDRDAAPGAARVSGRRSAQWRIRPRAVSRSTQRPGRAMEQSRSGAVCVRASAAASGVTGEMSQEI